MPGIVDADATNPSRYSGVPKLSANDGRTGLFDIVELRMAKKPMMHRTGKNLLDMTGTTLVLIATDLSLLQEKSLWAILSR